MEIIDFDMGIEIFNLVIMDYGVVSYFDDVKGMFVIFVIVVNVYDF